MQTKKTEVKMELYLGVQAAMQLSNGYVGIPKQVQVYFSIVFLCGQYFIDMHKGIYVLV